MLKRKKSQYPITIKNPKTGVVSASEESWTDLYVSNSSICWNIHEPGADDFAGTLAISSVTHGYVGSPWPIHGLTGSESVYLVKGWTYQVLLTGISTPDETLIVGAGQFTY